MNALRTRLSLALLVLVTACGSGGGGGGGGDSTVITPEVQQALDRAATLSGTSDLLTASGSADGLRARLEEGFPELTNLIQGGGGTAAALRSVFQGAPDPTRDYQLLVNAYAIEKRRDTDSIPTLQAFLETEITGGLYWTPHFVTHALKSLRGRSDLREDAFYDLVEMEPELAASPSQSLATFAAQAGDGATRSCGRRYVLVDGSGQPLTYTDASGATQNLTVEGRQFNVDPMTSDRARHFVEQVEDGGGTYVDDDPLFPGSPTWSFNCAGYAFRGLNGGRPWAADPSRFYQALVQNSDLLMEVPESDARPGDKVFYFQGGRSLPGHVAEVRRVETSMLGFSTTITVRNADEQSGLWEAPIDASYFTGTWVSSAKFPTRKVYRWRNGAPPTALPDPAVATNPRYCKDDGLGSGSLDVSISVPGFSLSFDPQLTIATSVSSFEGEITIPNVPSIFASESLVGLGEIVWIFFDPRQITGPGTYTFGEPLEVFEDMLDEVLITYNSPDIMNLDDGSPVVFTSTGGTVTLTSYGVLDGDRLEGTFSATIAGRRTTSGPDEDPRTEVTLTGTITGAFDLEIVNGN